MTKSRPLKSAMVRGSRVRPHTKRRNSDRSVLVNSSITSQNHWISAADASMPLYVATDLRRFNGMSGLPHICLTQTRILLGLFGWKSYWDLWLVSSKVLLSQKLKLMQWLQLRCDFNSTSIHLKTPLSFDCDSEMTHIVSSGTLNSTIPYHTCDSTSTRFQFNFSLTAFQVELQSNWNQIEIESKLNHSRTRVESKLNWHGIEWDDSTTVHRPSHSIDSHSIPRQFNLDSTVVWMWLSNRS